MVHARSAARADSLLIHSAAPRRLPEGFERSRWWRCATRGVRDLAILLGNAIFPETTWRRRRGRTLELAAGEVWTFESELAELAMISRSEARRGLRVLEDIGFISVRSLTGLGRSSGLLVHVSEWEEWLSEPSQNQSRNQSRNFHKLEPIRTGLPSASAQSTTRPEHASLVANSVANPVMVASDNYVRTKSAGAMESESESESRYTGDDLTSDSDSLLPSTPACASSASSEQQPRIPPRPSVPPSGLNAPALRRLAEFLVERFLFPHGYNAPSWIAAGNAALPATLEPLPYAQRLEGPALIGRMVALAIPWLDAAANLLPLPDSVRDDPELDDEARVRLAIDSFVELIYATPFLVGKVQPKRSGRRPFRLALDFLLGSRRRDRLSVLWAILCGKYEPRNWRTLRAEDWRAGFRGSEVIEP